MEDEDGYFGEHVAASYDDSSEIFEPGAVEPAVEFLAELADGGRALELGIGTGRIALPLADRGVGVHGIDLSRAMVARLRAKPGGDAIGVTIGDFATTRVAGTYSVATGESRQHVSVWEKASVIIEARLPGMARTPDDMMSAVSRSLAARTGRSVQEWVALVQASGLDPLDQNAVRGWLRREYGVPQNSQWAIADAAAREAGWVPPTVSEYVERQYAGAKAALRPVYEALAAAIGGLGHDVTAEGRGTYIPFVRGRQFAAIAAAARDRVDLGLRFTDPPGSARLAPATGPGQATHKLSLRTADEVDDEVLHLLRVAYEQNP